MLQDTEQNTNTRDGDKQGPSSNLDGRSGDTPVVSSINTKISPNPHNPGGSIKDRTTPRIGSTDAGAPASEIANDTVPSDSEASINLASQGQSPWRKIQRQVTKYEVFNSPLIDEPLQAWVNALEKLSDVLRTAESRRALRSLKDEEAQLMIDYLHSVLSQPVLPKTWLRKHTTIALYRLCRTAKLHPHYYVLRDIGVKSREDGGSFSDIYKGHLGDHVLCLKVVRLNKKSDVEAALGAYTKEAVLWGTLRHSNIVPFYGIFYLDEAHTQLCLVSPWMKNSNIVDYLKGNSGAQRESLVCIHFFTTIPESLTNPKIYDVALGLAYLQEQKLIHSDLKGMNILVNDGGRACITDFGLSFLRIDTTIPYGVGSTTALGGLSSRWTAPELVHDENNRPTLKSDVWAFGCVCFEVLTSLLPFHRCRTDSAVISKLLRGELPSAPDPQVLAGIDDDVRQLLTRCWSQIPDDRPSCQKILEILKSKVVIKQPTLDDHGVNWYHKPGSRITMTGEPVDLTNIREILGKVCLLNSFTSP
ncbi:kinase-like protein [Macrolepiota fuliginosa MF-IS2]|uniref:Kinase-like protein n=1 Tax=Macrolepiota fuliginosa MF-IS2 TaxID=1400762 RepID=A0A9P5XCD8_9AGAR|nr:kinase-like protein [Macrolepiota fuliginosa MF-IS2]